MDVEWHMQGISLNLRVPKYMIKKQNRFFGTEIMWDHRGGGEMMIMLFPMHCACQAGATKKGKFPREREPASRE